MFMVTEEILLILGLMILVMLYRYGSLIYMVAGYIFMQGLTNIYYPQLLSRYLKHDIMTSENLLSMNSATSMVFLGVITVFIMSIKDLGKAINVFRGVVILECILVLLNRFYMKHTPYGMLLTSTMDGMFLGMALPFMFSYAGNIVLKIVLRLLPIFTIFVTDSAIGEGAMVLGLTLVYLKDLRMLAIPAILGVLCLYLNPNLFNDSGRVTAWTWAVKWWWNNANIWLGTGIGTYWSLSYLIQKAMGVMNENDALFTFLHNDWIQALIETGIVGVTLIFTLFCNFLWKVRKNRVLFASITVYGICAFLNFPVRNIISASFGMLLIRLAMEE